MVGIKDFILSGSGETYPDTNTVTLKHNGDTVTLRCPVAYRVARFKVQEYKVWEQAFIAHPETDTKDLAVYPAETKTYIVKENYFDAGSAKQIKDQNWTIIFVSADKETKDAEGNVIDTTIVEPGAPEDQPPEGESEWMTWLKKNWWVIALLIGIIVAVAVFVYLYQSGAI